MEWIKYSDRVPEEKTDCWVCTNDNTVTRGEYINFHELYLCSGFGSDEEFIKDKYIKCWMKYYTPEPPKD